MTTTVPRLNRCIFRYTTKSGIKCQVGIAGSDSWGCSDTVHIFMRDRETIDHVDVLLNKDFYPKYKTVAAAADLVKSYFSEAFEQVTFENMKVALEPFYQQASKLR